jgi:hypothetical protein
MSKVILITWRNMMAKVLPQLRANMQVKHRDNGYEELVFR